MALRIPGSLVLAAGLLALGFAGGATSLAVQRWQTHNAAETAAHELTGGNAQLGEAAFARHGCGACHAIRAVDRAEGQVGPALDSVAVRGFLAGRQPNDPQHMIAWVQHPQLLEPGVGMPEMGLTYAEARDVAAYLYTLR
jgi:cytochrome c2